MESACENAHRAVERKTKRLQAIAVFWTTDRLQSFSGTEPVS
jgi:hypothetical protein